MKFTRSHPKIVYILCTNFYITCLYQQQNFLEINFHGEFGSDKFMRKHMCVLQKCEEDADDPERHRANCKGFKVS